MGVFQYPRRAKAAIIMLAKSKLHPPPSSAAPARLDASQMCCRRRGGADNRQRESAWAKLTQSLAFKDDGGRRSVNSNSLCCSGGVMCLCVCVCVRGHLCMHGYMHASSEYSDTLNACTFSGRVCKCAHVCVPKRTLRHVPCLHKTSEQH